MIRLVRSLRWITTTALSLALVGTACSGPTRTIEEVHFSDYVNPFIGASTNTEAAGAYHGLGKTFPGATTPFGMVQVSPNTITGGDNGSGYSYEHETIEGFAFTQMSGIGWYGDLGNLLVMPTVGDLRTNSGKEGGVAGIVPDMINHPRRLRLDIIRYCLAITRYKRKRQRLLIAVCCDSFSPRISSPVSSWT